MVLKATIPEVFSENKEKFHALRKIKNEEESSK
jgi:hypothetical protein